MIGLLSKIGKDAEEAAAQLSMQLNFGSQILAMTADSLLCICGFPGDVSKITNMPRENCIPPIPTENLLSWVKKTHGQDVDLIVFNLSGYACDSNALKERVVEYRFPGLPAPPMDALVEMALSIKSWRESGSNKLAFVHDISGRRSALVVACALVLMHASEDRNFLTETSATNDLWKNTVKKLGKAGEVMLPSQRRYFENFSRHIQNTDLLTSVDSKCVPRRRLKLERVIVNGIPDFVNESDPRLASPGSKSKDFKPIVCRPCMKVMQEGKVVGGTAPDEIELGQDDGCFSLCPEFPCPGFDQDGKRSPVRNKMADCFLEGDVILRFYHAPKAENARPVPMFSIPFHTGFVPDSVFRLSLKEIDGTLFNSRFPQDMFVDIMLSFDEISLPAKKMTVKLDSIKSEASADTFQMSTPPASPALHLETPMAQLKLTTSTPDTNSSLGTLLGNIRADSPRKSEALQKLAKRREEMTLEKMQEFVSETSEDGLMNEIEAMLGEDMVTEVDPDFTGEDWLDQSEDEVMELISSELMDAEYSSEG